MGNHFVVPTTGKKSHKKTRAEVHEEREAKQTINYQVFFFEMHIKTNQKKRQVKILSQSQERRLNFKKKLEVDTYLKIKSV